MADILISADAHIVEPGTLWTTRLPKKLRDKALRWEYRENPDGPRVGRHAGSDLVAITFPDGSRFWNTRFRHSNGEQLDNGDDPVEQTLRDLEADGVSGAVLQPNLGVMGCFARDHEIAIAHARVYNDYAHECYGGVHRKRIAAAAAIPLTDPDEAVAEVERVAGLGFRAITCPVLPPQPYHTDTYDRVWAAAQAHGLVVTFHSFTGFDDNETASAGGNEMMPDFLTRGDGGLSVNVIDQHPASFAQRLVEQGGGSRVVEAAIMALIGSGVMERFSDLHFVFIEFNAHWLASMCAAMDKAFTLGIGQDGEWQNGFFIGEQPVNLAPFEMNEAWPYSLRPSEFVRRQVHVTFMDDPMAVACRHLTGVEALLWGNDFPHAEGTYPRSKEAIDELFSGVDARDRAAIVGGTTAALFNLELTPLA